MKISIDWLRDYVDIGDRGAQEVADILSSLGFPLEGIEYPDGDEVIDIEVTSNRGDCLGMIGIAREVAASIGCELKMPQFEMARSDQNVAELADVRIAEPDFCARYTVRVISGVKVGPSPEWMKKRLEILGFRSVNNVVDATNYAMLETGHPSHAFDYDKLSGKKITVRKGVKGERMVSIDETKCDLDEDMLVIADEKRPVAIAGVMGGLDTEISESTSVVLLEVAHFDPVCVRTASRKLALSSESSFRFERQIDRDNIEAASRRITDLIIQAAGGKAAKGVVDVYPDKFESENVQMRFSRMNKLLGIEVEKERVEAIFRALSLGPEIRSDDVIAVKTPAWRHDLYREVDLIEEVARSVGYDSIPTESKINIEVVSPDKREKLSCRLRSYLAGCGFFETINVTFTDQETAELFAEDDVLSLSVKDEARKAGLLRQTLIGSLMTVYEYNHNAGNVPCSIYEIADTFKPDAEKMPTERTCLTLLCDCDLRDLRGVIDGLFALVDKHLNVEIEPVDAVWASAAGRILVDGKSFGVCGIVSDKVAGKFSVPDSKISVAELDFDQLLAVRKKVVKVKPVPRFPAIERDLSLIIDEKISWADITGAVNIKAPAELEEVCFAGIYRGKPIKDGKKSVTVSLRFRDEDGTLRHEIVDGFESEILEELKSVLNAELRTS